MNVFTFVFLVVTVALCADLMRTYIKGRNKRDESAAEEIEQTVVKIDALEERIQVLERIITERPFDLKKQIDSL
jgi:superfamily II DNA/RNA helicase